MGFRWLFTFIKVAVVVSLAMTSGCRKRSANSCSGGDGLAASEWNGASLSPNQLSLTFDDIAGDATEDIASYLQSMGAASVFFAVGSVAADRGAALAKISGAGHLIGSLGWSGQDLSAAADPVLEVRRADVLMQAHASGNVFLIRSSGGWNAGVSDALKAGGLSKYAGGIGMDIGWKLNGFTDDLECQQAGQTAEKCAAGYATEILKKQRGIVNFRATSPFTLTLLRILIPRLQSEAYSFVRVDQIPAVKAKLVGGADQAGKSGGATCDDYK